MMKKALLTILIILGLSYTSSSLADVKNLPIICSLPTEFKKVDKKEFSASELLAWEKGINLRQKKKNKRFRDEGYVLTGAELDSAIEELMQNPKLILQQGFFNHEEKVKSLKLKCPRGSKMIKPYNKKAYKKNKQKISPSYLRELRTRLGWLIKEQEAETIIFLIYLLSLENDFLFIEIINGLDNNYKVHNYSNANYVCYEGSTQAEKNVALKRFEFGCLQQRFHITQAKKNGNKWTQINGRIIEIPSKKASVEKLDQLKNYNIRTAFLNLPSICITDTNLSILVDGVVKEGPNKFGNLFLLDQNIHKYIEIIAKYPSIIFTNQINFTSEANRSAKCNETTLSSSDMLLSVKFIQILVSPYNKDLLKKGVFEINESYIKATRYLDEEDKKYIKLLINIISLNPDTKLPESIEVDDKTRKTFKINYGNLKKIYDQLQNNETYQFVRKVNQARMVFKILLLLL